MANVTYVYSIDWAGDGTFTGTGDNVTARILADTPVTIRYGRDQSRALAPITPGSAAFDLDNTSRDYSPENTSSPLVGLIAPARESLIVATFNSVSYTLWRGHLDEFDIDGTPGNRRLKVTHIDVLADLNASTISTGMYSGIRTGDAIGRILDAIGWSGGRDIDPGTTVIHWWWEEGTNAWDAILKVIHSEGPPSFVTVDATTGNFVYRDRAHRLTDTASKVVQTVFRDKGADPRFSWPLGYDAGWRDVINSVSFNVETRLPTDPGVVWKSDTSIDLGPGETRSVIMKTDSPLLRMTFVVWAGSGFGSFDVAFNRISGEAAAVTFTENAGGAARIDALEMHGVLLPVAFTTQVVVENAASIAKYGRRSYPFDAPWADAQDAFAVANLVIIKRSERLPIVNVRLTGATDSIKLQQLTRDLSDLVTIIDAETGLNANFYIEQIQHSITGAGGGNRNLETQYGCEKVGPTTDDPANVFTFNAATNGKFNTGRFAH